MNLRTPIVILLITCLSALHSQDVKILQNLSEEDQEALESIAVYPQKDRDAILVASGHPELLVQMDNIRTLTQTKFKNAVSGLSEDNQKRLYNVFRYPELCDQIVDSYEVEDHKGMDDLLQEYPEDIQVDAQYVMHHYPAVFKDVYHLHQEARNSFQNLVSTYPLQVREAYTRLDQLPSAGSLLANHFKLTVLLGSLYSTNSVQLQDHLDSLTIVMAERKAMELQDWKEQLESNPEAMEEFESAAKEFAGVDDYDDDVYDFPSHVTEKVIIHEVYRPYSYWFGWPSWYADECWYPYPWWYHSGFYYGPGHMIVIVGLPSNIFFNWHFYNDHHFYHYPHFTDHVFRHYYYGPRRFGAHVQPVLRKWHDEHKPDLPDHWFDEDHNRVNRIREYGKFKIDYDRETRGQSKVKMSEKEFLKKNANRYPGLKPVLTKTADVPARTKKVEDQPAPVYTPPTREPQVKEYTKQPTDRSDEQPGKEPDTPRKPQGQDKVKPEPSKRNTDSPPTRTEPVNPDQRQPSRTPPKKNAEPPKSKESGTRKPGSN